MTRLKLVDGGYMTVDNVEVMPDNETALVKVLEEVKEGIQPCYTTASYSRGFYKKYGKPL